MSVDRYTRFVLTVIAVCLVWIALRPVTGVPAAHAAGAPQGGRIDVNLVAVNGDPLVNPYDPTSIPVTILLDMMR